VQQSSTILAKNDQIFTTWEKSIESNWLFWVDFKHKIRYNRHMYNWSVDTKKSVSKKQKTIWELEQIVNFGLGGSKINKRNLKKHWNELHLDPDRKRFLEYAIWNKRF